MRPTFIAALVAGSLLVSATATGAQQPGPIPERRGAEVETSEGAIGVIAIVGFLALLLVIGVFVFLDDDDDRLPTSP